MVTINNKLFNSWLPPKASAEVEAHQAKLVVAHRQLGCDTAAERLHYCGYRDPSKFTKFTFRCDNRYCRRCGHRIIGALQFPRVTKSKQQKFLLLV